MMPTTSSGFSDYFSLKNTDEIDVDQEENLVEILQLLTDAGYYRAKIQGLGVFDKIVGGIVWCISLCARNVDVDLLYSENSTIGQKIALTEKIVKVLPELKCPYSLEPHQIQGLDSGHILPVIRWLVKEASFMREKLGDEALNFAVYQFGQQGWKLSDELERLGNSGVLPLVKSRKVYRRVLRMKHPMAGNKTDGQLTNAGDGRSESEQLERNVEDEADLLVVQGTDEHGALVYAEKRGTITTDDADDEKHGTIIEEDLSEERLIEELERLEMEETGLDEEIAIANQRSSQLEEELEGLRLSRAQFEAATGAVPKETLDQMRALLAERDEQKAAESAFKAQCREELAKLDAQIEAIKQGDGHAWEDSNGVTLNLAEQKAQSLLRELASMNGEIVRLGRQVGAKPSQAEMAQYQRRFVELCNQMVSKHRETKRQFTLHNTLVDVRNFMRKEIDMLDSIDRQKDLALREEYADSLLENLQKIARGVDESLDKKLCNKRSVQEQRDQLQEQLELLLDKHRLYTKTVVEFQQECQRNELLRQALDEKS